MPTLDPDLSAMKTDCLLAVLPGSGDDQRLAVFLVQTSAGDSQISLRQQTWAQGIGWYDQKTLEMEPGQLRLLRNVLGMNVPAPRRTQGEGAAILAFPCGPRTESA